MDPGGSGIAGDPRTACPRRSTGHPFAPGVSVHLSQSHGEHYVNITLDAAMAPYSVSRSVGNRITSRIDARSVMSMTSLSIPIPTPPVGGSPYSSALM